MSTKSSHDSRKFHVEGKMYDKPIDPEYQYRKIYLALIIYIEQVTQYLYEKGGAEMALECVERGASAWASKLGAHIVRDFNLPKDLEGVGKLMEIYNALFSSYNIKSTIEGDSVITVLNDCTHWDMLFKEKNIRCEESCTFHEIPSAIKAAGNYTVTMPESRPCGASRCVWKITKVDDAAVG